MLSAMFRAIGLPELVFIFAFVIFAFVFIAIVPFWKIFSRLGFSGALSLLMLVPVVNVIVLFYVAFTDPRKA
jgi:hypothetical protein